MEVLLIILALLFGVTLMAFSKTSGGQQKPPVSKPTYPPYIPPYTPPYTPPDTPPNNQPSGGDKIMNLADKVAKITFLPKDENFLKITEAIVRWSDAFDLSPNWVAAVAIAESSYGQLLTNPFSSAIGVMQITKDTVDTINNIIRGRYPQYIEYSKHTHSDLLYNHDSNIMHACVYMRWILDKIAAKYKHSNNIFNDYILMQYLYYMGPGYLDRFYEDYSTIVHNIKEKLTESTVYSPYNWGGISYVRKVLSYFYKL